MNQIIPCLLIICFSIFKLEGQNANDARFTLGVESSFILQQVDGYLDPLGSSFNINLTKPVKQFSLETTLGLRDFSSFKYGDPTGNKIIKETKERSEIHYGYSFNEYQLKYLALGLGLRYRLPCNCVFPYFNFQFNFLTDNGKEELYPYTIIQNHNEEFVSSDNLIKDVIYSIELGIGFQMPVSKLLRLTMKPSYVLSGIQLPVALYGQMAPSLRYMQISFGIEKGFN